MTKIVYISAAVAVVAIGFWSYVYFQKPAEVVPAEVIVAAVQNESSLQGEQRRAVAENEEIVPNENDHSTEKKMTERLEMVATTAAGTEPVTVKEVQFSLPENVLRTASANEAAIGIVVGPTTVRDSMQNSWKIALPNPNPLGRYTYYADWGDERDYQFVSSYNAPQSVNEFVHTYYTLGTYVARFRVRGPDNLDMTEDVAITVEPANPKGPIIQKITPTDGGIGATIVLTGTGFTPTGNIIHFGSGTLPPVASDGGEIYFTLPQFVHTYCLPEEKTCIHGPWLVEAGKYQLYIENANGISPNVQFRVLGKSVSEMGRLMLRLQNFYK